MPTSQHCLPLLGVSSGGRGQVLPTRLLRQGVVIALAVIPSSCDSGLVRKLFLAGAKFSVSLQMHLLRLPSSTLLEVESPCSMGLPETQDEECTLLIRFLRSLRQTLLHRMSHLLAKESSSGAISPILLRPRADN